MKKTVYADEFVSMFDDYGRGNNFSVAGRLALYEWVEQCEEDGGREIECDIIAFCVEWSEYESALDCISAECYDFQPEGDDDEEREESALEWLRDNTMVIEFSEGILIQDF